MIMKNLSVQILNLFGIIYHEKDVNCKKTTYFTCPSKILIAWTKRILHC